MLWILVMINIPAWYCKEDFKSTRVLITRKTKKEGSIILSSFWELLALIEVCLCWTHWLLRVYSQKRTKALLEYLPQFKPNSFVESCIHLEISKNRLWVTNLILHTEAVILASDRQSHCPARRNMLYHYIHFLLYNEVKCGAENNTLLFAKGAPSLETGCISSTVRDYPFPIYP